MKLEAGFQTVEQQGVLGGIHGLGLMELTGEHDLREFQQQSFLVVEGGEKRRLSHPSSRCDLHGGGFFVALLQKQIGGGLEHLASASKTSGLQSVFCHRTPPCN